MLRCLAFLLLATGLAAGAPRGADAVPSAVDPGAIEAPADPALVRAVQERLSAIGLFDGPLDGRPSLALDAAVRAAQRSLDLPEDGAISAGLLAGLSDVAEQATALRARLEAARTRQAGEARALLLSSAATRDLVSGIVRDVTAPAGPCGARAETACLIAPALAALDLIDEADRRDWVLAGLARALTRDAAPDLARALIARIADPRTIVAALGDMAVAHAEAGDVGAAAAAADAVPGDEARLRARVGVARALMARGDGAGAARLIAPVAAELRAAPEAGGDVALLADAALVLTRSGDRAGADDLFGRAESMAASMADAHDHDLALGTLAQALAEVGAIDRASAVVDAMDDPWRRAPLLAHIAAAAVGTGDLDGAGRIVARIDEPRYRAPAEARLAAAFARAGQMARGLAMLDAAETTSGQVPRGFARSFALASVAVAAGELGQSDRAALLAESVSDRRLRARALSRLAGSARALGDPAEAARLEHAAAETAATIADPVERAAARAELMLQGASDEAWADIVADVVALDEPWQRVRSLASLAAIAVRLAGETTEP